MTIRTKYYNETDIIEGCVKQDKGSQKQLYFMYCDEMYSTAYRILKEEHMAADALHDAFLLIFRDINKLKKYSSLRSWIKSVVINISLKMC